MAHKKPRSPKSRVKMPKRSLSSRRAGNSSVKVKRAGYAGNSEPWRGKQGDGNLIRRPLRIEIDREEDGRFIAEIPTLPGVLVYGIDRAEALRKVKVLALHVLAERIDQAPARGYLGQLFTVA